MTGLIVSPEDGEAELLGKEVNELQEDIEVLDNMITGTLNYVTGYTGFSGDTSEQNGHYLALKFEHPEGATTSVQVIGGTHGPVALDSDMNCVFRIANNDQKIKVVTTLYEGGTITNVYDLSMLELRSA